MHCGGARGVRMAMASFHCPAFRLLSGEDEAAEPGRSHSERDRLPVRDHAAKSVRRSLRVSCRRPLPSSSITNICDTPVRAERNAMLALASFRMAPSIAHRAASRARRPSR